MLLWSVCEQAQSPNVDCKSWVCSRKSLHVFWWSSTCAGLQGCGFKMFRAGSRGNASSNEIDASLGSVPWFPRWVLKGNNDNLLHAVGNSWKGRTLCSYSRPSNLLLNSSILPEASVPCFRQFKLGPCRLVYKWPVWKWRNMGLQLLQERQPYSFGRRSASLYWLRKYLLPSPGLCLIKPIHLICAITYASSCAMWTFLCPNRFYWNKARIVVLLSGCRNTMSLRWLCCWGKFI